MSYAIAVNAAKPLKANVVTGRLSRNFDMPGALKTNVGGVWPTNSFQNNPGDWLHGDFKDVSFQFLHPMYQKMIDLGKLDEN